MPICINGNEIDPARDVLFFDGCHKFYVADISYEAESVFDRYDILDWNEFAEVYAKAARACGLQFLQRYAKDENGESIYKTIVEQGRRLESVGRR